MGIVFNYLPGRAEYTEVVFSPTGVAKLNRFENGGLRSIATASSNAKRNVAFEVQLENGPNHFAVLVDGVNVFQDILIFDVNPAQFPEGGVGLITHWARAASTMSSSITACRHQSSLQCKGDEQYAASGNLAGLIYNYQDANSLYAGDYFEVVFSATGVVQMNKFIEGVRYPVRTGTYNVPHNTFFDVQVYRTGIFTLVSVNGTVVIDRVPQGELRGGFAGAVTHWAKGRFDDVRVEEYLSRPPSQL